MGTTLMGRFDFSSWTLHMASIMIFGTVWGLILREWKGSSPRTHALNLVGLLILVSSTVIVGYGNHRGMLDTKPGERPTSGNEPVAARIDTREPSPRN